jgi:hypothetical protein
MSDTIELVAKTRGSTTQQEQDKAEDRQRREQEQAQGTAIAAHLRRTTYRCRNTLEHAHVAATRPWRWSS